MVFAISDIHLSLGTAKPMDIFKGWDNYVERLEQNWRAMVGEDDTVVIAGDISWAMKLPETAADFAFIHRLPGQKIILKGNHDLWWTTLTKMNDFVAQQGFSSIKFLHNNAYEVEDLCVCGTRGWFFDAEDADAKVLLREAGRLETSIQLAQKTGKEPVAFLHYPPLYNDLPCQEIYSILQKHQIKRCFYGHVHGRAAAAAFAGERDGIDFRLISCDFTGFSPVRVS